MNDMFYVFVTEDGAANMFYQGKFYQYTVPRPDTVSVTRLLLSTREAIDRIGFLVLDIRDVGWQTEVSYDSVLGGYYPYSVFAISGIAL